MFVAIRLQALRIHLHSKHQFRHKQNAKTNKNTALSLQKQVLHSESQPRARQQQNPKQYKDYFYEKQFDRKDDYPNRCKYAD